MPVEAREILDFWADLGPQKWWRKDAAVDRTIEERFGQTHSDAAHGRLDDWLSQQDGALALIIVLDQFSRNMFRNSPRAFAQDTRSAHLVHGVMANGLDRRMRDDIGVFCYMPLMHAENIHDQEICVREMKRLGLKDNIKAAEEHRDIIARFGRFPHRNDVLGRETTAAEQTFLDEGGFSG